ncbi:MAG: tyrosine-protein phosphatase [Halanaerobiaceae bacterium]
MIDLHSHILPGVDDGARNFKEALAIATIASEKGITKMVATPHFRGQELTRKNIEKKIENLQLKIEQQGLEVEILPGAEVYISSDLGRKVEEKKVPTINNSRYLLVEFPFREIPAFVPDIFYDLRVMDYYPIIAHPERYDPVISSTSNLYELVKKDYVYAQINAGSLRGDFGSRIQKTAIKLIKMDLIHFIGSDVHSSSHRGQFLAQGMEFLADIDRKYVTRYQENVQRVIADQRLEVPPPQKEKKKTLWSQIKTIF